MNKIKSTLFDWSVQTYTENHNYIGQCHGMLDYDKAEWKKKSVSSEIWLSPMTAPVSNVRYVPVFQETGTN